MRGEHFPYLRDEFTGVGSSPHARGTPTCRALALRSGGIIPACAGNTPRQYPLPRPARDHPRMRGEHQVLRHRSSSSLGSSPHARGTHLYDRLRRFGPGIIPACAGNTDKPNRMPEKFRDHPRMRGEHVDRILLFSCARGSSPHARGTHPVHIRPRMVPGIIPACAGNTAAVSAVTCVVRDHPRMRGEHFIIHAHRGSYRGSSPHARGTPVVDAEIVDQLGIIPACAGNTRSRRAVRAWKRDHPRMRGEHICSVICVTLYPGSSPHARGTPVRRMGSFRSSGIIPACAGNTTCRNDTDI